MKKNFLHLLFIALSFQALTAQNILWTPKTEKEIMVSGTRQIIPQKYITVQVDLSQLQRALQLAPKETVGINNSVCFIELPLPDGTMSRFRVVESPVMAPELMVAYPNIKTYSIKGLDDIYASGKIDITEFGFHAMVLSPEGDFFIDPYCLNNTSDYISYYTADFVKDPAHVIPESGLIIDKDPDSEKNEKRRPTAQASVSLQSRPPAQCAGNVLRTYRLAVACTGEYAVASTGQSSPTKSQVLSKVVTTVNRVDGVYEKEVAVRMVLIPNDTIILFTNAATDPFTGNANTNAGTLINLSQTVITATIGSANFDIGHTFSTGGGGLANLGCVCVTSQKARGITGSANPVGDPYDIDYVAHEIGHQFNGNHTFNAITGNCNGNRNGSAAVEPGSGVTIMAYAGLCGSNNISSNSIPYFHGYSYDEIYNFVSFGAGSSCPVTTTTGNSPPVVMAPNSIAVPKSTPFSITGSATDPENDPLTFSWEEMDTGAGAGGNWNSGNAPYFRSYAPVTTPTRLFPRLSVVQSNNYTGTAGEYLPGLPQMLNFRMTVRDNKMGGGGVCYGTTQVLVDTAGPFVVMYPSATGISWVMNSQTTILWDPAHTDQPPVACDSVRILISYNSGLTYSTLVGSAPNFGFYSIVVPTLSATINTCRIRIEAKGNVFYDIGNFNFTISDDPTVGIQEVSRNNSMALNVWPNPTSDLLWYSVVNLNPSDHISVTVHDLLGHEVFKQQVDGSGVIRQNINVANWLPGVYFVSVKNGGSHAVHRFVKD